MPTNRCSHPGLPRRAIKGVAAAVVAAIALGGAVTAPVVASAATVNEPTSSAVLPFDMPSTATLRSSPRLVFAHYMPFFSVSIDNQSPDRDYYATQFLTPTGENGKHSAYGGFLRDRPLGRAPRPETNWEQLDQQAEIRQAIAAGIDGFVVLVGSIDGDADVRNWTQTKRVFQSAAGVDPGFKLMIQPDMSGGMKNKTVDQLAAGVQQLATSPSAFRLPDGRVVISPYNAESHDAAWWAAFMERMRTAYGINVALVPVFQNEQLWAESFKGISYGMGNWGSRNPKHNNAYSTAPGSYYDRAKRVQALGKVWMQPVSVQDERPNQGIYDEAENTQNLRDTWHLANEIAKGTTTPNWVQLTTWNDYSENTDIAPSMRQGYSLLDVNAYYVAAYKSGVRPKVVRDTLYVTHRTQPYSATPSYPQTVLMQQRPTSSTPRDTVEALAFLTAPATVKVTIGGVVRKTCDLPAGVTPCIAPLAAGEVRTEIVRDTSTVGGVASPHRVGTSPAVQDLQYVAVSSRREGASFVGPAPLTTSLTPTEDSYANAGAPAINYGSSSSLSSRGSMGAVSFLRYTLPPTPAGRVLTSARLLFRTTTLASAGTADAHSVALTNGPWSEATLTWNNRPAVDGPTIGTINGAVAVDTAYSATLDRAALSGRAGTAVSVTITSVGTDSLWLWSRDHPNTGYRPTVVLTYN